MVARPNANVIGSFDGIIHSGIGFVKRLSSFFPRFSMQLSTATRDMKRTRGFRALLREACGTENCATTVWQGGCREFQWRFLRQMIGPRDRAYVNRPLGRGEIGKMERTGACTLRRVSRSGPTSAADERPWLSVTLPSWPQRPSARASPWRDSCS